MRKILLSISLVIILMISLIGCSSKGESTDTNNDSISSEENLFNVKVTLPSIFFETADTSTIESEGKAKGIHDVLVNENGSVTYTMNKKTHRALLDELKTNTDEMISDTLADKDTYSSFDKIEYNDDLTKFNIYVDSSKFNPFESFSALTFYLSGNIYQAMNSVDECNIKTIVNFIDKNTNEVIESGDSSKIGSAQ
ncbi:hypothetical protein [Clostridium tertium]|uniref:Uncharacterized protein n=1 Tax=Clostridium tertium TaxID=1559 RepID=A0A6N2YNF1_9CLOT